MDNFLTVAGQVAILFVLMGVGALLRKADLLKESAIEGLVNLLLLVVTPCLIVDVFQRPFSPEMLGGLGLAFMIAVLGHAVVILLAYLMVRHRDENVCRPMRLAAVFSNAGFMGLPLEQAVLGDTGVFYGVVYVVVFNLVMWSWGYGVMRKEKGKTRFDIHCLVNPGTVGVAFGLPLFFLSAKLPACVGSPIHLISGLNTPLAMMVIGYCLVGAKLGKVLRMPVVYVATAIRLVVYPLLVVAAMYPFRHQLNHDMTVAITVSASAPVAAMVSMFAAKFGRDVETSVAAVSGSTLLSILTMPPVIALAMSVL